MWAGCDDAWFQCVQILQAVWKFRSGPLYRRGGRVYIRHYTKRKWLLIRFADFSDLNKTIKTISLHTTLFQQLKSTDSPSSWFNIRHYLFLLLVINITEIAVLTPFLQVEVHSSVTQVTLVSPSNRKRFKWAVHICWEWSVIACVSCLTNNVIYMFMARCLHCL